jgi:hypothetical protein
MEMYELLKNKNQIMDLLNSGGAIHFDREGNLVLVCEGILTLRPKDVFDLLFKGKILYLEEKRKFMSKERYEEEQLLG